MADRDAWLKALALVSNGQRVTTSVPCPACGNHQLEVRYIVDPTSRVGYALFWCGACLHGITVSRVRAPERMVALSIDDPDSTADVPDFVREN
ncbi:hypothetical protein [Actinacidiphila sp. bgisy145]|uniref:hypothetical protein n=1 Tax=Actinacidiphila sp. bgisy145 TaxID=3413792 RepID=UPI003EBC394B